MMTRAEWIEVVTIGIVVAVSWLLWPHFSATMSLWQIVLTLSTLWLAQSLVRDLTILLRNWYSKSNKPRKETQCFCLESTVGVIGVIVGIVLIGLGNFRKITINHWEFLTAIAVTMLLGFIIKDWVITWNPFGLRREKDHLNLIVRWKRQ